jgi:hypothetical protein
MKLTDTQKSLLRYLGASQRHVFANRCINTDCCLSSTWPVQLWTCGTVNSLLKRGLITWGARPEEQWRKHHGTTQIVLTQAGRDWVAKELERRRDPVK